MGVRGGSWHVAEEGGGVPPRQPGSTTCRPKSPGPCLQAEAQARARVGMGQGRGGAFFAQEVRAGDGEVQQAAGPDHGAEGRGRAPAPGRQEPQVLHGGPGQERG